MSIIVNLDVMLAKRKMSMNELSDQGWNYTCKFIYIKK